MLSVRGVFSCLCVKVVYGKGTAQEDATRYAQSLTRGCHQQRHMHTQEAGAKGTIITA